MAEYLLNTTRWNQGSPFNNKLKGLPPESDKNWVVGCNALAVAQVLKYWSDKGYTFGSKALNYNYTWTSHSKEINVPVNLPAINFNFNIPNNSKNSWTNDQKENASLLCQYLCLGIKSGPEYKSDPGEWNLGFTGAWPNDIINGLKNYITPNLIVKGYKEKGISFNNADKLTAKSWDQMKNIIISEVQNNRPVIIAGYNWHDDTQEYSGGHTFVCDGYKEENGIKYGHFNYGYNADNAIGWSDFDSIKIGYGTKPDSYRYNSKRWIITINPTQSPITPDNIDQPESEIINYGDVNKDNLISNKDVIDTVKLIYKGKYVKEGDINRDSVLNCYDIEDIYNSYSEHNLVASKINHLYRIKKAVDYLSNLVINPNSTKKFINRNFNYSNDSPTFGPSLEERKNDSHYPEYWYCQSNPNAQINYCPEYHKWPLVWYNKPNSEELQEISNALASNISNTYPGDVFLPSEWIFPAWEYYYDNFADNTSKGRNTWRTLPNTKNVYWVESYNRFVLYFKVGETKTVYTNWNNMNLWMDNYKPREDTLYAEIPTLSEETFNNQTTNWSRNIVGLTSYEVGDDNYTLKRWLPENNDYQPNTKIWNGNTLISVFDNITDFKEALQQCFINNNGSVKLAPKKLYYCVIPRNFKTIDKENMFEPIININNNNISNSVFDGQGGGIFIRTIGGYDYPNETQSEKSSIIVRCYGSVPLFRIKNVNNFTIKNLTVASIRDNFEGGLWGAYGTQPRFSIAGSGVNFVKMRQQVENITFENIETYNLRSDFDISGKDGSNGAYHVKNVTIRNCNSYCVTGNTLERADDIEFDKYNVTWNGWAGSGIHLFYFQGASNNVTFKECSFKQLDKYRQPMFDWQGDDAYTEKNTKFDRCVLEGAKLFFASGATNNPNERTITFEDCIINTLWTEYGRNTDMSIEERGAGINTGKRANWTFDNCKITCPKSFMHITNTTTLTLNKCNFIRLESYGKYPFFTGSTDSSKYNVQECSIEVPDYNSSWTENQYILNI